MGPMVYCWKRVETGKLYVQGLEGRKIKKVTKVISG